MQFRKGDVVTVQGVVEYDVADKEGLIFVKIIGDHQSISLLREKAKIEVLQPMYEVGDSVRWDEHGAGIIHAINNGHAWIGMDSGDYCTRQLTAIKRADASAA